MIGYIEGIVRAVRNNACILLVHGIGYKVFTTKETLARLSVGQEVSFWTHLAVREDALDLYGCSNEDELHFFGLLLTVSGIGPKSALTVLDTASVETLRSAILKGDAKYLTNVSGIGKKTAEKILLELKDKITANSAEELSSLAGDSEALEAMRSLGYSAQEAREALRTIPAGIEGTSNKLREALRILGK